ncbi:MAG: hypothetical protein ACHQQQ_08795 [Bacteroidota bacterium]
MKTTKSLCAMSIDEVINDAIKRESTLMGYYSDALKNVGPDAWMVFNKLCDEHRNQVRSLQNLLIEIQEIRELTDSIAD